MGGADRNPLFGKVIDAVCLLINGELSSDSVEDEFSSDKDCCKLLLLVVLIVLLGDNTVWELLVGNDAFLFFGGVMFLRFGGAGMPFSRASFILTLRIVSTIKIFNNNIYYY